MAADILVHRFALPDKNQFPKALLIAYSATHVPVGEDQSQHLEFARKSARKFNHAYGPHLVLPKTIMCKS
jgi:tryptophanyl-tRNA synthetase